MVPRRVIGVCLAVGRQGHIQRCSQVHQTVGGVHSEVCVTKHYRILTNLTYWVLTYYLNGLLSFLRFSCIDTRALSATKYEGPP